MANKRKAAQGLDGVPFEPDEPFEDGWTREEAAALRRAAPVAPEGPCPVHGDGCAPFCEGMRPVEELGSCCGGCRHPIGAGL